MAERYRFRIARRTTGTQNVRRCGTGQSLDRHDLAIGILDRVLHPTLIDLRRQAQVSRPLP